jgi:hypothetical protein
MIAYLIKDMLIIWMRENNSTSWNVALKFVQFNKNNSHHSGIYRTPYKAMFGSDAKMDLTSSPLRITSFYTSLRLWMSWFTVDNTAIRPPIFQLFDYISSEFPTVV